MALICGNRDVPDDGNEEDEASNNGSEAKERSRTVGVVIGQFKLRHISNSSYIHTLDKYSKYGSSSDLNAFWLIISPKTNPVGSGEDH